MQALETRPPIVRAWGTALSGVHGNHGFLSICQIFTRRPRLSIRRRQPNDRGHKKAHKPRWPVGCRVVASGLPIAPPRSSDQAGGAVAATLAKSRPRRIRLTALLTLAGLSPVSAATSPGAWPSTSTMRAASCAAPARRRRSWARAANWPAVMWWLPCAAPTPGQPRSRSRMPPSSACATRCRRSARILPGASATEPGTRRTPRACGCARSGLGGWSCQTVRFLEIECSFLQSLNDSTTPLSRSDLPRPAVGFVRSPEFERVEQLRNAVVVVAGLAKRRHGRGVRAVRHGIDAGADDGQVFGFGCHDFLLPHSREAPVGCCFAADASIIHVYTCISTTYLPLVENIFPPQTPLSGVSLQSFSLTCQRSIRAVHSSKSVGTFGNDAVSGIVISSAGGGGVCAGGPSV